MGQDPLDTMDLLLEDEARRNFKKEERSRYSREARVTYRNGRASTIFLEDLNQESPWLNHAEFKDKYRMTRATFWVIVGLIEGHPVFESQTRKQAPVAHQLMTLLCFLGTEGNGMSNQKG
jgi:hypothetical protein